MIGSFETGGSLDGTPGTTCSGLSWAASGSGRSDVTSSPSLAMVGGIDDSSGTGGISVSVGTTPSSSVGSKAAGNSVGVSVSARLISATGVSAEEVGSSSSVLGSV